MRSGQPNKWKILCCFEMFPQGLKPRFLLLVFGTTEVVP